MGFWMNLKIQRLWTVMMKTNWMKNSDWTILLKVCINVIYKFFIASLTSRVEPMHIVPLYSLLPSEKQLLVFQSPPVGSRLVVVSTNIAETSLTIPGIRYVVDCGRAKEVGVDLSISLILLVIQFQRRYDIANGIQSFQVAWTSKASAAQRAGRAGRTGPGHCYRLYSSALFEHHFEKFAKPEIQRMPIDGVVLQMKSMHIDAVVNFPFPTPPERPALLKAEKTLVYLGALRISSFPSGLTGGQISELGRAMALFPLSPRFSRMLVSGQQHGCLPYIISIVSAMSVGDPFIYEEAIHDDSEEGQELGDLKREAVEAKEKRSLLRKAFFQSHLVGISGPSQWFSIQSSLDACFPGQVHQ
jgi:ATP-dependent RNA helicase DHX37/DHR1